MFVRLLVLSSLFYGSFALILEKRELILYLFFMLLYGEKFLKFGDSRILETKTIFLSLYTKYSKYLCYLFNEGVNYVRNVSLNI